MFDFIDRTQKEMTQQVPHLLGVINAFKICSVNYKPVHPVGVGRKYMRSRLLSCIFFTTGVRAPPGPTKKFVWGWGVGRVAHPVSSHPPNPAPLGIGPTGFVSNPPVISVGYLPH